MAKDNKLKSIVLTIKEIDKDHNGFVTSTELDDIIKLYYRKELMEHFRQEYGNGPSGMPMIRFG